MNLTITKGAVAKTATAPTIILQITLLVSVNQGDLYTLLLLKSANIIKADYRNIEEILNDDLLLNDRSYSMS